LSLSPAAAKKNWNLWLSDVTNLKRICFSG
jgi:hypothetical protein